MKNKFGKWIAAVAALASTGTAMAHGGHGVPQAHWHATDVYGFAVVVVLATAAVWFSRSE
ncbi:MAG: hypothetical protein V4787_14025 [Pseudomonadota bacterium]